MKTLSLHLSHTPIGDNGLQALAMFYLHPGLPNCQFGDSGAPVLGTRKDAPSLKRVVLDLRDKQFDDSGARQCRC